MEYWFKISSPEVVRRFLSYYSIVCVCVVTIVLVLYRIEYNRLLMRFYNEELSHIQLQEALIEENITIGVESIKGFMALQSNVWDLDHIREEIPVFMSSSEVLKNIYIIKENEIIFSSDPDQKDKMDSVESFLLRAHELNAKEIVVFSENQEDERRWFLGAFNSEEKENRELMIIEVNLDQIIKNIQERPYNEKSIRFVLDEGGQYVVNSGYLESENGLKVFAEKYPNEWQRIKESSSGQFVTNNGLFSFRTLFIQQLVNKHAGQSVLGNHNNDNWILGTFVSKEELISEMEIKFFLYGSVSFLVLSIGFMLVLAFVTNSEAKKRYNEELERNHVELLNLMEELRFSQEELVEKRKLDSLDAIVAGISHEMSTPIGNCVTGISYVVEDIQTMKEKFKDNVLTRSEMKEYMESIEITSQYIFNNLSKTATLLRKFKAVICIETEEDFTILDIVNIVKNAIDAEIISSGVKSVEVKYEGPVVLKSKSSAQIIWDIFRNLTNNALQHGFEGGAGKLNLLIREYNGKVRIVLEDNGVGMSEEIKDKIMNPFYTTKMSHGNIGLGLNVVYNYIIRNLKGTMRVESQLKEGTKIIIEIPKN